MSSQVIRDEAGREVVRFVTSSGVVAYVATQLSPELLAALAAKLQRKLAMREVGCVAEARFVGERHHRSI